MNSYEAKQEARRERLEAASERAAQESDAHHRASHAATAGIPFGQPILVGHHSEGRHRRAVERSWNQLGKAVEADKRAKELAARAAAVGSGGISSDDPDAVAKLREKLAGEVAERDGMKKLNAVYRAAKKAGVAGKAAADIDPLVLAALALSFGFAADNRAFLAAVQWVPAYSFEKGPFTGWPLSNLGANIKRIEARIADLERRAQVRAVLAEEVAEAAEAGAPPPNEMVIGEARIVQNFEANRLQVFFPGKPSYDVRAKLKSYGFRWAPSEGAWQRHLSNAAGEAAKQILNSIVGGVS